MNLNNHPRNISIKTKDGKREKLLTEETEEMMKAIRFYCIPGVMNDILIFHLLR